MVDPIDPQPPYLAEVVLLTSTSRTSEIGMQEGGLHPKLSLLQLTQMVVAQERGKTGTFPGVFFFLFYWAALTIYYCA